MINVVQRGDVYMVELEGSKGSEQGGMRPCLIIQNDMGNKYSPTTIIAPITSKKKRFGVTHMDVSLTELSTVLFEQIRTVDKLRLKSFLGHLNTDQMVVANKKLLLTLGM